VLDQDRSGVVSELLLLLPLSELLLLLVPELLLLLLLLAVSLSGLDVLQGTSTGEMGPSREPCSGSLNRQACRHQTQQQMTQTQHLVVSDIFRFPGSTTRRDLAATVDGRSWECCVHLPAG